MTLMEDKMENLVENYNYDNSIFEFREKARLEFVQKFPLENLKNLKLEEYTGYGNKETFTYGLESDYLSQLLDPKEEYEKKEMYEKQKQEL